MPSTGKLLFASFGVAWAAKGVVKKPQWVLGEKLKDCKSVCTTYDATYECKDQKHGRWPQSQAEFETVLENIKDDKGEAKCSTFVDVPAAHKFPFEEPAISKGVCWYYSNPTALDCTKKPTGDEQLVCLCKPKTEMTERDPIPGHIKYPAVYKRSEKATISFTIKFPFFPNDAFECLGAQAGKKVTGSAKHHPESFFKMAYGIKQSLGTEAAGIEFIAPKTYSDPLVAKVDVYAAPVDMSGAELFLAKSRIKAIGPYLVKKYPELKMCAKIGEDVQYETEFGESPVFPASVKPTGSWSPANKAEILTDSVVPDSMTSVGVVSAGVLLVAGVVVMWRRRQELEVVSTTCE